VQLLRKSWSVCSWYRCNGSLSCYNRGCWRTVASSEGCRQNCGVDDERCASLVWSSSSSSLHLVRSRSRRRIWWRYCVSVGDGGTTAFASCLRRERRLKMVQVLACFAAECVEACSGGTVGLNMQGCNCCCETMATKTVPELWWLP